MVRIDVGLFPEGSSTSDKRENVVSTPWGVPWLHSVYSRSILFPGNQFSESFALVGTGPCHRSLSSAPISARTGLPSSRSGDGLVQTGPLTGRTSVGGPAASFASGAVVLA